MPDQILRSSVARFHAAVGVHRMAQLNRHERMALAALRAVLISEEGRELREADEAHRRTPSEETLQHLAKEAADLLYVTAGTADVLSTPLTDPYLPRAVPPFFAEGMVIYAAQRVANGLDLLVHQIDMGWTEEDIASVIDEIGAMVQDLADAIFALAASYRIPIFRVFDEVHASNMSKLDPETGHPVLRDDGKILKGPAYKAANLSFLSMIAA